MCQHDCKSSHSPSNSCHSRDNLSRTDMEGRRCRHHNRFPHMCHVVLDLGSELDLEWIRVLLRCFHHTLFRSPSSSCHSSDNCSRTDMEGHRRCRHHNRFPHMCHVVLDLGFELDLEWIRSSRSGCNIRRNSTASLCCPTSPGSNPVPTAQRGHAALTVDPYNHRSH